MARHMFVVLSQPAQGLEDEYNEWYTGTHLTDVLALDGYVAAQRFRFVPQREGDVPLRPYLALYEMETDDLAATHALLAEAAGTDAMPFDPAIDMTHTVAWYYEQIAPRRTDGRTGWPLEHPHMFVVMTAPVAGQEAEFDDWYTNQHLDDVLKLDDYASAERFRFAPLKPEAEPFRPYMALYETDTTDVPATQRRLTEVVATPAMPFSPAIDRSQSVGWYYEPISERRTA